MRNWPEPWPIENIKQHLLDGRNLYMLVRSRQAKSGPDVREYILEAIVQDTLIQQFGIDNVTVRKQIGTTLAMRERPFPARTMPDIAVKHSGLIHIAEVKSNRTDYRRFDNVFDSRPFRAYLNSCGHSGGDPWEVEQDLIKLRLYKELSPLVGSCLFLMVDAYEGSRISWTNVFESRHTFLETMRTDLVKGWTDKLLVSTRIEPLKAQGASARLITCAVHSWNP
jgi:hypothetical protein